MSTPLNVIALISGGKDSIYSLLHCQRQGHRIVAIANLHPAPSLSPSTSHDLNSFMYQTVGHTLIPLYSQALDLPLYRQHITGTAVQTGASYAPPPSPCVPDETEALLPLLRRVVAAHPQANAVSSGAILSTYQRTRIESVAVRLGLVPLSYLWQFPLLGGQGEMALLRDMRAVGLEARIVKVASGGLDEGFLWADVASGEGMERVRKAVSRFGAEGEGAVIGEGGEFETMVLNGPAELFKGRIVVEEGQREIMREEGGVAWIAVGKAKVDMAGSERKEGNGNREPRVPDLLDVRFQEMLRIMQEHVESGESYFTNSKREELLEVLSTEAHFKTSDGGKNGFRWTVVAKRGDPGRSVSQEMDDIVSQIKEMLNVRDLSVDNVISTLVLLRSMKYFGEINKVYGALFCELNPPARVTISCGDVLPTGCNIVIHINLCEKMEDRNPRKALHVQSRSYWAPANIGPYSQAVAVPVWRSTSSIVTNAVFVAGQIPLIPATMALPPNQAQESTPKFDSTRSAVHDYILQTVLSLQHLWRIGKEMGVSWWAGGVAYLSQDSIQNIQTKATLAGVAWEHLHGRELADDEDDEEDRDLWDEQHRYGQQSRATTKPVHELPNWSLLETGADFAPIPPFLAAEVEELPRESVIEWHALLGITNGPIKEITNSGTIDVCFVGGAHCFTMICIPYLPKLSSPDLEKCIDVLALTMNRNLPEQVEGINYRHPSITYLDVSAEGHWKASEYAGVVPCRSLWSRQGQRLAAVYCYDDRSIK